MKNSFKILTFITILLVTFLACTKDTDVLFSFDFELKEVHSEIATINYKEPTFVRIDPERVVTSNVYSFSYDVSEGAGFLRYVGGNALEKNIQINCENLELDFEFIGTELGAALLNFTVQDQDDRVKTIPIAYEVVHNEFTWDANSTTTSVTTGQETPLTLILENTGKDESVTYKSKVYFTQGEGQLFETDNLGNSTSEIELNEYSAIIEDIYNYNIKLAQTGINKVIFEAEDSNGQIKKDSILYNVDVNDFSYIGTPENNSVFNGGRSNINFQITELIGSGDTYQSRFEFVEGNATIKRLAGTVEETLAPGVSYNVESGQYPWIFEASEVGEVKMLFYAKSSSEIEHQIPITINVNSGSFELTATPSITSASVNDEVPVILNISENGPTSIPYTVQYSTSANGLFKYNNIEYLPGETFEVNDFNFSGTYKGLIEANHTIIFSATSVINDSDTAEIEINFNQDEFSFTAVSENENITLNDTTNFNFTISDDNTDASYQLYYSVTGNGNGELSSASNIFTAGSFYAVTNTAFSWEFKATQIGPIEYTFFVINNSGVEIEKTITMNVTEIPLDDFTFTAISTSNSEIVETSVPVNFNINETQGNSTYKLSFTTSKSGILIYEGNEYLQGDLIDVPSGSFTGNYKGLVSGQHEIIFNTQNNNTNPISRNAEETITFENIDFDISTNGNGPLFINESKQFNLFLTQLQSNPTITYSAIFSIANGSTGGGTISLGNGTPINYGSSQSMEIGTNELLFNSNAVGNVTININVIDSNGQSKSTDIEFNVEDAAYIFSGAPQQSEIGVGGNTNLNFNISEDIPTGANYEMKYVTVSGNGTVKNAGNALNANTYYDVNLGNYNWNFEASPVTGNVELFFTARNKVTNETKDATISINVTDAPTSDFEFSAIATSNSEIVGTSVPVNFNINEIIGNSSYKMKFTSSSSGVLTYQGNDYLQGDLIDIPVGAFVATYSGNNAGNHIIEFTATNTNTVPISKTDSDEINFSNIAFDINTNGSGSLFLNESKAFNLFLSQLQSDTSITYSAIFSIINGSTGGGNITLSNGTPINYGTAQNINIGTTELLFIANAIGDVSLNINVIDSNGQSKQTTIDFNVINAAYDFSGAPQQSEIGIGGNTNLNFNITEDIPTGANYEMKYVLVNGNGTITNAGITLNANTYYDVNIGNYNWNYQSSSIPGSIEILFTARNKVTNETKEDVITIEVTETPPSDFEFTAIPTSNAVNVGTSVPVNLNINEIDGNSTYKVKFISSGTGVFTYLGNDYLQGDLIDVPTGGFVGSYKGLSAGFHDIEFIATNDNTIPISKSSLSTIKFSNIDFDLTTSGGGSLFLNQSKPFNVNLTQLQNDPNISYSVVYNIANGSSGGGNITLENGNPVPYGTPQNINLGSTGLLFNSNAVGEVTLNVNVIDSNGQSKNQTIDFSIINVDFQFSGAFQESEIEVNESTLINFNIAEDQTTGADYELKYVITNGSGIVKNPIFPLNANTYYDVDLGNFSWSFEAGPIAGNVELFLTARNKVTNETKDITLSLEVLNIPPSDFDFSAISTSNSEIVGSSVPVNFNITETVGNSTYKMKFVSSSSGILSYQGNDYLQGDLIDVPVGGFVASYTGNNSGNHNIEFTVTNSNTTPVSKTANDEINFSNIDFEISTNGSGSLFLNESKAFNLILSQLQSDPSITYSAIFSIENGSSGDGIVTLSNGNPINYGTPQNFNIGTTGLLFTGNTLGDITLNILVTDSNNQQKSTSISFEIEQAEFDFTGAAQDIEIEIENSTNINFNISEDVSTGTNYEMKYVLTNGNGIISNASNILNANTYYSVNIGNFDWSFEAGNSPERVSLLFTVRNTTTNETKNVDVDIDVITPPIKDFTLSSVSTLNSDKVDNCVNINFTISEINGYGGPYTLIFESDKQGVFEFESNTYLQGQEFIVTNVDNIFTGCYKGQVAGSHNINFTAKNNNDVPISKESDVDIEFLNYDFTFDVDSPINNGVLNETKLQIGLYTQETNLSQTLTFSSSLNGTLLYDGNTYNENQPIQILESELLNGSFLFGYTGSQVGTHNIVYKLTGSNGVEKTKSITLEYTRDCEITNTNFGEWQRNGVNVNDTFTWSGGRVGVGSDVIFNSICDEDITLTLSLVSTTTPTLPRIGAKYQLNAAIPGIRPFFELDVPVVFVNGQEARLFFDTSNTSGLTGTRVVKFTLSNGIFSEEILFTQVFE